MSERSTSTTTTTAEPGSRPAAATKTDTGPIVMAPEATPAPPAVVTAPDVPAGPPEGAEQPPGAHPTAPVSVRPRVRQIRGPLTRMGPWAPVAGAFVGLLAGLVVVLLLAGAADGFDHRLALALTVVGLGMLGASGTLLADEVRMIRNSTREVAVRPAWVETTVPLLTGLTPARLLLLVSAFVLFLAAFVAR